MKLKIGQYYIDKTNKGIIRVISRRKIGETFWSIQLFKVKIFDYRLGWKRSLTLDRREMSLRFKEISRIKAELIK